MNRKIIALIVLGVSLFAAIAYAVDSFTVSAIADVDSVATGWDQTNVKVIKVEWLAASDGSKANGTIPVPRGRLVQVVTDPGATAPADDYDITLLDAAGVDVMGGALLNRDTANTEQAVPLFMANSTTAIAPMGRFVYSPLTATFTNQANANCDGVMYLYFAE